MNIHDLRPVRLVWLNSYDYGESPPVLPRRDGWVERDRLQCGWYDTLLVLEREERP